MDRFRGYVASLGSFFMASVYNAIESAYLPLLKASLPCALVQRITSKLLVEKSHRFFERFCGCRHGCEIWYERTSSCHFLLAFVRTLPKTPVVFSNCKALLYITTASRRLAIYDRLFKAKLNLATWTYTNRRTGN